MHKELTPAEGGAFPIACCWQVFTRNFTLFFVNQFSTLHAGYRGEGGARKFSRDFYHKTQLPLH